MYSCTNADYTPVAELYASVAEFLDMCRACFGAAPNLRADGLDYRDDSGAIVLRWV